ncbi:hypothetical protein GW17_00049074, partial [Ensete ventricosum]
LPSSLLPLAAVAVAATSLVKKEKKKREKNFSHALLFLGSPAQSVARGEESPASNSSSAGDSFSPRGEKEQGDMIKYDSHLQLDECFELETKILGVMVSIRLRVVYLTLLRPCFGGSIVNLAVLLSMSKIAFDGGNDAGKELLTK